MMKTYIDTLLATKIPGIKDLCKYLEENNFDKAPCSGAHHLAYEGGLVEHSLNVFRLLLKLNIATGADLDYTDMVVVALLHDIGKLGQFGKPNYIPAILKSGEQSKSKPYTTNPELTYEEHEIRSIVIASKFIDLTEEQQTAILHHNGLFSLLDYGKGNHNFDSSPLCFLLHTADMYCSRFIEVTTKE